MPRGQNDHKRYEGYKLISIQKGEANLGDLGDDKERFDDLKKMYETTAKWWVDFIKAESTDNRNPAPRASGT